MGEALVWKGYGRGMEGMGTTRGTGHWDSAETTLTLTRTRTLILTVTFTLITDKQRDLVPRHPGARGGGLGEGGSARGGGALNQLEP